MAISSCVPRRFHLLPWQAQVVLVLHRMRCIVAVQPRQGSDRMQGVRRECAGTGGCIGTARNAAACHSASTAGPSGTAGSAGGGRSARTACTSRGAATARAARCARTAGSGRGARSAAGARSAPTGGRSGCARRGRAAREGPDRARGDPEPARRGRGLLRALIARRRRRRRRRRRGQPRPRRRNRATRRTRRCWCVASPRHGPRPAATAAALR